MTSVLAQREADWLDLVSDVLNDPPERWPYLVVSRLLHETFRAEATTIYDRVPGRPLQQSGWPPGYFARRDIGEMVEFGNRRAPVEHPVLRYYLATGEARPMQVRDVPDRYADARVKDAWRERGRAWGGVQAQLAIPVLGPGQAGHRSFIVGREEDYSPEEVFLAYRLRRLFVGVDRHIAEHARLGAAREAARQAGGGPGSGSAAVADELGVTARELAVLELLAHGLTAAAIGRRLAITERTVQKHLQRVYAKLAVGDRLSAVQRAQRIGLLAAPWPPRNTHFPH
jgi:DNA-binding CsgD family transcriptional regulator